jgi:hypothetical protein
MLTLHSLLYAYITFLIVRFVHLHYIPYCRLVQFLLYALYIPYCMLCTLTLHFLLYTLYTLLHSLLYALYTSLHFFVHSLYNSTTFHITYFVPLYYIPYHTLCVRNS